MLQIWLHGEVIVELEPHVLRRFRPEFGDIGLRIEKLKVYLLVLCDSTACTQESFHSLCQDMVAL